MLERSNLSEKILEVRNLKTYFYTEEGIIKAVNDVSFVLRKGETLGIAGESGSGKSVTSLSILKLVPWPPGKIVGGEIIFNGRNLLKLSSTQIRQIRGNEIAMIFQDPMTSLNPVFTIGKQIMESIILHQKVKRSSAVKKVINILREIKMPEPEKRFKQFPHEFSGGMRQRVMIAIALACNPKILIADEPTTALDVTIQAQILKIMNEIKHETGSSIILITHDLGVLAEMADNIIIMYAGKIVEYGAAETIFYNPSHPYTLGLLESIPKLDEVSKRLVPISGNPPSLLNLPPGCSFNARCKYAKEVCFNVIPELKEIHTDHLSACHLTEIEKERIKREKKNIRAYG